MKGKESTVDNLYDNLVEQASSLFDEKETATSSDTGPSLEELRNRAANFKKRLLLHKNHADRHNLKAICEEGLKLTKKITRGTGEMDLLSLEDELDIAETDLELCEQEFHKEIKRYDEITEFLSDYQIWGRLINGIYLPDDHYHKSIKLHFQYLILKAKIDIFSVPYTPEDLLSEFHTFVSQRDSLDKFMEIKDSLKSEINNNDYVTIKDELLRKIDIELTIDNIDYFKDEIHKIIEQCRSINDLWLEIEKYKSIENLDHNIQVKIDSYKSDLDKMKLADIERYTEKGEELKSDIAGFIESGPYKNLIKERIERELSEICYFPEILKGLMTKIDNELFLDNLESLTVEINSILKQCRSLCDLWKEIEKYKSFGIIKYNVQDKIDSYKSDLDNMKLADIEKYKETGAELISEIKNNIDLIALKYSMKNRIEHEFSCVTGRKFYGIYQDLNIKIDCGLSIDNWESFMVEIHSIIEECRSINDMCEKMKEEKWKLKKESYRFISDQIDSYECNLYNYMKLADMERYKKEGEKLKSEIVNNIDFGSLKNKMKIRIIRELQGTVLYNTQIQEDLMTKIDHEDIDNLESINDELTDIKEQYSLLLDINNEIWKLIPYLVDEHDDDHNLIIKSHSYFNEDKKIKLTDIEKFKNIKLELKSEIEERVINNKEHAVEIADQYYKNNNLENAEFWYHFAAEKGDKYAKHKLELISNVRHWMKTEHDRHIYNYALIEYLFKEKYHNRFPFKWLEKFVKNGYTYSEPIDWLYRILKKHYFKTAFKWQMEAAIQGNSVAQFNIGRYYLIKENILKAISWQMKAAKQGFYNAFIELCYIYLYETEGKNYITKEDILCLSHQIQLKDNILEKMILNEIVSKE